MYGLKKLVHFISEITYQASSYNPSTVVVAVDGAWVAHLAKYHWNISHFVAVTDSEVLLRSMHLIISAGRTYISFWNYFNYK